MSSICLFIHPSNYLSYTVCMCVCVCICIERKILSSIYLSNSMTFYHSYRIKELPRWLSGKESICQCRRHGFGPRVGKSLWRRKWQPAPVVLPEKFHGQKNLVCYRPWVQRAERDWAHTHRDGGIQSLCAQTFAGDNKGYKASLL